MGGGVLIPPTPWPMEPSPTAGRHAKECQARRGRKGYAVRASRHSRRHYAVQFGESPLGGQLLFCLCFLVPTGMEVSFFCARRHGGRCPLPRILIGETRAGHSSVPADPGQPADSTTSRVAPAVPVFEQLSKERAGQNDDANRADSGMKLSDVL